jgi:hypothetical protein
VVPLSATVEGWKLQVAFCGRLLQENCSDPAYPPTDVIVSVSVTELPDATLNEEALEAMVTDGGIWLTEKMRVATLLLNPRELLV